MIAAFFVSGRVQGVAYRHHALICAERRSLRSALAVNLPDHRVYVCAEGDAADLEHLAEDLLRGPAMARVESVEPAPIDLFGRLKEGFTAR
ncbi:MAG TPA: acylphosphatase [Planctomycetota bacterium]|nr:acylphosphatase [Planctomycetota bacterium]